MRPTMLTRATPAQLAAFLSFDLPAIPWTISDLAVMWEQLMSAPLGVELARAGAGTTALVSACEEALPRITRVGELIGHRAPPMVALDAARRFAKVQSAVDDPDVAQLGRALYFAVLATAVACDRKTSKLSEAEFAKGLAWTVKQAWLDAKSRDFLQRCQGKISAA